MGSVPGKNVELGSSRRSSMEDTGVEGTKRGLNNNRIDSALPLHAALSIWKQMPVVAWQTLQSYYIMRIEKFKTRQEGSLAMNVLLGNVVPEKGAFPNELVGNEDSGAFMLYGAP